MRDHPTVWLTTVSEADRTSASARSGAFGIWYVGQTWRVSHDSSGRSLTPKQGLAFVARHGVVLQAARGPVPSLAETIAGGPIRGSWWGHRMGHEIFEVAEAISASDDVLVCKLVNGNVTYVHRRLWPALVKLGARFRKSRLAKVWNEHTQTGAHRSRSTPFPDWVPLETKRAAERLSVTQAEQALAQLLPLRPKGSKSLRSARARTR